MPKWLILSVSFFLGISAAYGTALDQDIRFVQSKALEGDKYYQGALALFYKYGEKGLPIDLGESERWAKLAAKEDGGVGMAVLASIELERNKVEQGNFYTTRLICIPIFGTSLRQKIQLPFFVWV